MTTQAKTQSEHLTLHIDQLHIDDYYKSITIDHLLQFVNTTNCSNEMIATRLNNSINNILSTWIASIESEYSLDTEVINGYIRVLKPKKPKELILPSKITTDIHLKELSIAVQSYGNRLLSYHKYDETYTNIVNHLRSIIEEYVIDQSCLSTVPEIYRANVLSRARAAATNHAYGNYYNSLQIEIDELAELFSIKGV